MAEDEMVRKHYQLNGQEFEQDLRAGDGTGKLGMLQFMLLQRVGHDRATELTDLISLLSKGLSSIFSSTTVSKHQFFGAQTSLWPNSHIRT